MGAVGTSADNSLAEAFDAALKRETLQDENSWCRHRSPIAYGNSHATTLPPAAQPRHRAHTGAAQAPSRSLRVPTNWG